LPVGCENILGKLVNAAFSGIKGAAPARESCTVMGTSVGSAGGCDGRESRRLLRRPGSSIAEPARVSECHHPGAHHAADEMRSIREWSRKQAT